jgi:ABC-type multidrug transport system ATPase subunit
MHDSSSNQITVAVKDVSKSFDHKAVIESISFQVSAGRCFCICGPNAAGKSTLLKIISGLIKADSGTAQICGQDVQKNSIKSKIGIIQHKSLLYPQLTVRENITVFANLYGIYDKNIIESTISEAKLEKYEKQQAQTLSCGVLQKLAIARALIQKPLLLLADEPFSGLDSEAVSQVQMLLQNYKNSGGAIVMTSHNIQAAVDISDILGVLYGGKLVLNKPAAQIDKNIFVNDYLSFSRTGN